jgi:hypothetical protein
MELNDGSPSHHGCFNNLIPSHDLYIYIYIYIIIYLYIIYIYSDLDDLVPNIQPEDDPKIDTDIFPMG